MSQGLREEEEEALEEVTVGEDIEVETIIGVEAIAMIGTREEMVSNLMNGMAAGEEGKEAMIAIEASIVEVAIAIGLKNTLTSLQIQMTQILTRSMPLRKERIETPSLTTIEVEAEEAIEEEEAEVAGEIINRITSRKMQRHLAFLALKTSPSIMNREVAEEEETTSIATTIGAVEEVVVAEVATISKRINSSPLVRTQWLKMATRTSLT